MPRTPKKACAGARPVSTIRTAPPLATATVRQPASCTTMSPTEIAFPVESTGNAISVGDIVVHDAGWRTVAVASGGAVRIVDTGLAPAQAFLGVLGMPGLTAYSGLTRIAEL